MEFNLLYVNEFCSAIGTLLNPGAECDKHVKSTCLLRVPGGDFHRLFHSYVENPVEIEVIVV
jgi:hypothetical protein